MIINGNTYKIPEIGYNESCELEKYGFSILLGVNEHMPATTIRAFLALCIGDLEQAGKELEEHLTNPDGEGSSLEEIASEIKEAIENSPFFQKLMKKLAARVAKTEKPQNTKPGEK